MGAVLWRYKVRLAAILIELLAVMVLQTDLYPFAAMYAVTALLLSVGLEHGGRFSTLWAGS